MSTQFTSRRLGEKTAERDITKSTNKTKEKSVLDAEDCFLDICDIDNNCVPSVSTMNKVPNISSMYRMPNETAFDEESFIMAVDKMPNASYGGKVLNLDPTKGVPKVGPVDKVQDDGTRAKVSSKGSMNKLSSERTVEKIPKRKTAISHQQAASESKQISKSVMMMHKKMAKSSSGGNQMKYGPSEDEDDIQDNESSTEIEHKRKYGLVLGIDPKVDRFVENLKSRKRAEHR